MRRTLERRISKLVQRAEDGKPAEPGFVLLPKALPGTPEHDAEVKAFEDLHKGAHIVVIKIVSGRKDGSMARWGGPVIQ